VLDRQPLFAAKYHMVPQHWQIIKSEGRGTSFGNVEAVALDQVPKPVLGNALRAARLIGNGLYGVDVKQIGRRVLIMEINDNPNLDAGLEDSILGNELYDRIINVFVTRLERRKKGGRAKT